MREVSHGGSAAAIAGKFCAAFIAAVQEQGPSGLPASKDALGPTLPPPFAVTPQTATLAETASPTPSTHVPVPAASSPSRPRRVVWLALVLAAAAVGLGAFLLSATLTVRSAGRATARESASDASTRPDVRARLAARTLDARTRLATDARDGAPPRQPKVRAKGERRHTPLQTLLVSAQNAYRAGEYAKAMGLARQALLADPKNLFALHYLGASACRLNKPLIARKVGARLPEGLWRQALRNECFSSGVRIGYD